jgi:hypothetical protein
MSPSLFVFVPPAPPPSGASYAIPTGHRAPNTESIPLTSPPRLRRSASRDSHHKPKKIHGIVAATAGNLPDRLQDNSVSRKLAQQVRRCVTIAGRFTPLQPASLGVSLPARGPRLRVPSLRLVEAFPRTPAWHVRRAPARAVSSVPHTPPQDAPEIHLIKSCDSKVQPRRR